MTLDISFNVSFYDFISESSPNGGKNEAVLWKVMSHNRDQYNTSTLRLHTFNRCLEVPTLTRRMVGLVVECSLYVRGVAGSSPVEDKLIYSGQTLDFITSGCWLKLVLPEKH